MMRNKRLQKELLKLQNGPLPPGISLVSAEDLDEWAMDLWLPAAAATPSNPEPALHPIYKSSVFRLRLRFPKSYPIEPPDTCFVSSADPPRPIPLHPHIYSNGIICLDLLGREGWSPVQNVESICVSLQSMLSGNEKAERPEGDADLVRRVGNGGPGGRGVSARGLGFVYEDETV